MGEFVSRRFRVGGAFENALLCHLPLLWRLDGLEYPQFLSHKMHCNHDLSGVSENRFRLFGVV